MCTSLFLIVLVGAKLLLISCVVETMGIVWMVFSFSEHIYLALYIYISLNTCVWEYICRYVNIFFSVFVIVLVCECGCLSIYLIIFVCVFCCICAFQLLSPFLISFQSQSIFYCVYVYMCMYVCVYAYIKI